MKTIRKIAKLELGILFYSPIAWFLLIVFIFQCGFEYTSTLNFFLTYQELGSFKDLLTYLTSRVFGPPRGVFTVILTKVYLYLPLLTMGLMSREISSGTIKLLFSSPVKIREIIFGKFLAMMVYNLLLVSVLVMLSFFAHFNIQHADMGLLFSGVLGIYLLLCAYSAIGLFMSCLTSYQVVAALSTFVIFAVLAYIGTIWQDIDFVRDLTYSISLSGRAEYMIDGLITTKELFYFGVIVYIFLGLSILKLRGERESVSALKKGRRYAILIISAMAIGYLTSRPIMIGYYDATATRTQTLTERVQQILKEMGDEPMEVTSYINLLDNRFFYGQPDQRNIDMDRWAKYLRFKSNISFKYLYYWADIPNGDLYRANPKKSLPEIARSYAKTYKVDLKDFKSPEEMKKILDLDPEQNRYVMQLKYKGKSTFLRLFNDQEAFPTERETAAALKRLMVKLPKIGFMDGEYERSAERRGDKDFYMLTRDITFRYALINQGFDIETVNLTNGDIPEDISTLVIADPKVDFSPLVRERLQRYIDRGGNLMIAGEPGKQALLNPLLAQFGVQLMDGTIIQESKDFAPELVVPHLTPFATTFRKSLQEDFRDSLGVVMQGAAGLSYETGRGFDIQPLLLTDSRLSWNKKGKFNAEAQIADDQQSGTGPFAIMVVRPGQSAPPPQKPKNNNLQIRFSAEEGDQRGALPTALSLSRKLNGKEQRIVVTGDADFMSNRELTRNNMFTANFKFNTAIFGWLSYGEFPVDTSRPPAPDVLLTIASDKVVFIKIALLGVLPAIFLIFGAILLIRRKRK